MFTLAFDPAKKLVTVKFEGFWDEATVTAYEQASAALTAKLPRDRSTDWLVDSTEFPVQSLPVVERLAIARRSSHDFIRKMAIIIPMALARMQASRLNPATVDADDFGIFESLKEAQAWLAMR